MSRDHCPILFVIGPQRSGTTWIYDAFVHQDEGLYLDRLEKENYHFSKRAGRSAEAQRRWLLKRITGRGEARLCVDVCSTYFGHPQAVEGILAAFPEARFAYIRRDEAGRRKSFEAHRRFNARTAWLIGYEISWALYEKQSDFDGFDAWMKERLPAERLAVLEFEDLKRDGGETWMAQLSALTGCAFGPGSEGVVNASRGEPGLLRQLLFVGVRLVQATRVHIYLRALKARLTQSDFASAHTRGVR